MKRKSAEYHGSIYRLHLVNSKDVSRSTAGLYLIIYKLSDNGNPSVFESLRATCTIPVPHYGPIINFYIDVLENSDCIKIPFILVETESRPLTLCIFTIDSVSSKIQLFKKCVVTNNKILSSCNLHLLPGPTFAWIISESNLYFKTLIGSECADTEIRETATKVLYVNCIHSIISDHFSYLIFVKTNSSLNCSVLCLDFNSGKFLTAVIVNADCFLPKSYCNLVSLIYVGLHENAEKYIVCRGQHCCAFAEAFARNYVCACTTDNQFIIFVNGAPRYNCNIPVGRVTSIFCLKQFQQYQVSFLLKSTSWVALIRKDKAQRSVSVSKVWEGVSDVYFGDFCHTGRPVLLLLKDSSFPRTITNFLVAEISESPQKTDVRGLHESSEMIDTMVRALDKRVTAGQVSLNRAEESFQDKLRVLDCAVSSLVEYSRTGKLASTYKDVSLVEVALGFQTGPPCQFESICSSAGDVQPYCLKLVSQWQTAYRDQWILGWTFKNNSTKVIEELTGTLFGSDQLLEVRQRVFLHPGGPYASQPTLKPGSDCSSGVQPNCLVSVLLSLEIPVSYRDSAQMNAVVSYLVLHEKESFMQQIAFRISWNASDMSCHWMKNFASLSVIQQIMCHRVLQWEACLEVEGPPCFLQSGPTPEVLSKVGLKAPALLQQPAGGPDTFVFIQTESPLTGINFSWHSVQDNVARVSVHCRTAKQLLLFVHWLYDVLAKESSILLTSDPRNLSSLCCQMWESMNHELGTSLLVLRRRASLALKRPAPGERPMLPQKAWTMDSYQAFRKELTVCETDTDNLLRCFYRH